MNSEHKDALETIDRIREQPKKHLFGIDPVIDATLMSLFSLVDYTGVSGEKCLGQAHLIYISFHGRGKTDLMRSIAFSIGAKSSFMSGDPQLETKELTGGPFYVQPLGKFIQTRGPLFTNIFLFDEFNRNSPKVIAPTLQAMEERVVPLNRIDLEKGTMEVDLHPLYPISDDPKDKDELFFWFLATANPIEQEGTFQFSEASMDRFSFSLDIKLPPREKEKEIDNRSVRGKKIEKIIDLKEVLQISRFITNKVEIGDNVTEYIMRLIENSRPKSEEPDNPREWASANLREFVDENMVAGVSPRANYHFKAGVRTKAFMEGREYVTVEDVRYIAPLVMSHRIVFSPHVLFDLTKRAVVDRILRETIVPPGVQP